MASGIRRGVPGRPRFARSATISDLLLGTGTAALLFALAAGGAERLRAGLASRPLAGLGRFSYSTYCVHLPLLWLVWHFLIVPRDLGVRSSFVALLVAGLPAVYLGSYAFSLAFERPFLRHRSWPALRAAMLPRAGRGRRPVEAPEPGSALSRSEA